MSQKEMLETGRRSAISTSELGLYSDQSDRYYRNRYNPIVRKFVIGVMVVIAVILVAIFLYDFTSATSANSKLNQETKHIYILQNTLRRSVNNSKKFVNSTSVSQSIFNQTNDEGMQDRLDNGNQNEMENRGINNHDVEGSYLQDIHFSDAETRAQNFNNFQLKKKIMQSLEHERNEEDEGEDEEEEEPEGKQLFDNHALIYRVRQRYKYPNSDEDTSSTDIRPAPFRWEYKTPRATSFKRPRYPQLSQYRYPHSSKNIQDIIKYLTNNGEIPNKGIKFSGVYVNPKKFDLYPDAGEMYSNSDRSEEDESIQYPITFNTDPFYQYKPKHPSDVNLLAPSNFRFSPLGIHRYNPYYDPYYAKPGINYNKPIPVTENQYDNVGSYSSSNGKKRKPKPFSIMLDIYPITDVLEQNKKSSRPRLQVPPDDYDPRRPLQYNRGPKFHSSPQPVPIVALPTQQGLTEEEERQQMIFHLNLYPRRKNKLSRYDIIHKSQSMLPEERQQFMEKIMSPLESIAKHLTVHSAIEQSKSEESEPAETTDIPITRYQESPLNYKNNERKDDKLDENVKNKDAEDTVVPPNHKITGERNPNEPENYGSSAEKITMTTTIESECTDCNEITTIITDPPATEKNPVKDIDTVEGFQQFSDGLISAE